MRNSLGAPRMLPAAGWAPDIPTVTATCKAPAPNQANELEERQNLSAWRLESVKTACFRRQILPQLLHLFAAIPRWLVDLATAWMGNSTLWYLDCDTSFPSSLRVAQNDPQKLRDEFHPDPSVGQLGWQLAPWLVRSCPSSAAPAGRRHHCWRPSKLGDGDVTGECDDPDRSALPTVPSGDTAISDARLGGRAVPARDNAAGVFLLPHIASSSFLPVPLPARLRVCGSNALAPCFGRARLCLVV